VEAGRLSVPVVEMAPPDGGWAQRHRRMHLLQVELPCPTVLIAKTLLALDEMTAQAVCFRP